MAMLALLPITPLGASIELTGVRLQLFSTCEELVLNISCMSHRPCALAGPSSQILFMEGSGSEPSASLYATCKGKIATVSDLLLFCFVAIQPESDMQGTCHLTRCVLCRSPA
jgi:hypothetical protein